MKNILRCIALVSLFSCVSCTQKADSTPPEKCTNPWGGASATARKIPSIPQLEEARICLPQGFVPKYGGDKFEFSLPNDNFDINGRLLLQRNVGEIYKNPDDAGEYKKQMAFYESPSSSCKIKTIKGKRFLVVDTKASASGKVAKAYIHLGNGYMIGLEAHAPNDKVLSALTTAIENADIP